MTLKGRLLALVAGALLISLFAGGGLIVAAASRWVQSEIDADAAVARQLVEARIAEAAEEVESPDRIPSLLHSLETSHHLHAWFVDNTGDRSHAPPPGTSPAAGSAPPWLPSLLGVGPTVQEVPVTRGGRTIGQIVIATDPATEIAKVWRLIETGLVAICAVSGSTLLIVMMGLSRGLRPLARLADGLRRVADGDYAARVGSSGPSEIARLGRQFDTMAAQLQRMQGRMRQLTAQLVAVAERERREIARDLHDELGPCLLAANLDVSALIRLNLGRQPDAVEDCAKGLAGALDRMQTRVRRMIDRLHLGSVEPIDLGAAVTDLVGFWRERCPEIAWNIAPAECWGGIPEAIAPGLFRIIQEALGNAVRHSGAATIAVTCQSAGDETVIRIADDGSGIAAGAPAGFGLSGMRERIEALGGHFVIATGPGQGTTIEARLPAAAIARSADESWERVIA